MCGSAANTAKMEKAKKKKDRTYTSPYEDFLRRGRWLPHFIWDDTEDYPLNEKIHDQLTALSAFMKIFDPSAFNNDRCVEYGV